MPANTQFHHYIPRFILRRWAVDESLGQKIKQKKKPEHLNVYDLSQDTLRLGTGMISRSFGLIDMYKDTTNEKDAYHIEKSLSELEQAASQVISKLDTAISGGSVTLSRSEVNTLRKFLAIMEFRNGSHYARWMNETLDPPTMDVLGRFAAEHKLANTRDAYLFTIHNLLGSEHWEVENNPKIFSVTRADYKLDKDRFALALYAAPPGVEFILSETSFGIWQGVRGPMFYFAYMMANLSFDLTDEHAIMMSRLFPVTPKLALLLRSHLMMSDEASIPHERSYFADLPFKLPDIVYDPPPRLEGNLPNELAHLNAHPEKRLLDRMTFRIFQLSQTHGRMINHMLLENSTGQIAFMNIIPLYKSLLSYKRDNEMQHKVDFTNLQRKLIDAHRVSQLTFKADRDGVHLRVPQPQKLFPSLSSREGASSERSPAQNANTSGTTKKKRKKRSAAHAGGGSQPVDPSPAVNPEEAIVKAFPNISSSTMVPPTSSPSPVRKGRKKRGPRVNISPDPVSPASVIPAVAAEAAALNVHTDTQVSPAQTAPTVSSPARKGKQKNQGSHSVVDTSGPSNMQPPAIIVAAIAPGTTQQDLETSTTGGSQSGTIPQETGRSGKRHNRKGKSKC